MERSDQAESEKGHLFSLYHTHTVRPAPHLKVADSKPRDYAEFASQLRSSSPVSETTLTTRISLVRSNPHILITTTNDEAKSGFNVDPTIWGQYAALLSQDVREQRGLTAIVELRSI